MNTFKSLVFSVSIMAISSAHAVLDLNMTDHETQENPNKIIHLEINNDFSLENLIRTTAIDVKKEYFSLFLVEAVRMINNSRLNRNEKIKLLETVDREKEAKESKRTCSEKYPLYDFHQQFADLENILNDEQIVFDAWNQMTLIEQQLFRDTFEFSQSLILGELRRAMIISGSQDLYPTSSKVNVFLRENGFDTFMNIFQEQSQIKKLTLATELTAHQAGQLANTLKTNNILKKLTLNISWNAGDEAAKHIAEMLKENKVIEKLKMPYTGITPEGAKHISEMLTQNNTLKALNIIGCSKLGDDSAIAIANALTKNTTLTSLNVGYCEFGADGHKAILNTLQNNKNLSKLKISFGSFDGEDAKLLANIIPQMNSLQIINKGIVDTKNTQIILDAAYKSTSLKSLMMRNFGIGDEQCRTIAGFLKNNSTLTKLDISQNLFTAEGTGIIKSTLENNSTALKMLTLPYHATSDKLHYGGIKGIKIDRC